MDAVQVSSNGVEVARFEASTESTFTTFSLQDDAVETLTLTSSSGKFEHEGIGLLEVRECARLIDPDISLNTNQIFCGVGQVYSSSYD